MQDDEDYWKESLYTGFDWNDAESNPFSTVKNVFSPKTQEENEKILFSGMVDYSDGSYYTEEFTPAPRDKVLNVAVSARYRQGSTTVENQKVLKDFVSQDYSASNLAKLQGDIQVLKRKLESTLHPKEVVKEMVNDQHCNLGGYRGRQDKVSLLDAAINSNDGNAIIRTVLHLKHNTKPVIFQHELRSRPAAVEHYLAYLRFNNKYDEMTNVLEMFGRNTDAAMVMYQKALSSSTAEGKLRLLQKCYRTHFETEPNFQAEKTIVQGHINLLDKQIQIENVDAKLEKEGKELFKKIPRTKSLLQQSVLDTLYYCCLYHLEFDEQLFTSPSALKRDHRLSTKQFHYTVVSALAELALWNRMDEFLFHRNYLKVLKPRSEINMARVAEMLANKNAPVEVIGKYVGFVEDLDLRLELGKRFSCHEVVIETFVKMRDRVQLFQYKNKLPQQSREYLLAEQRLKQQNIKWKT